MGFWMQGFWVQLLLCICNVYLASQFSLGRDVKMMPISQGQMADPETAAQVVPDFDIPQMDDPNQKHTPGSLQIISGDSEASAPSKRLSQMQQSYAVKTAYYGMGQEGIASNRQQEQKPIDFSFVDTKPDYSVKQAYFGIEQEYPVQSIGQSEQKPMDFSFQNAKQHQTQPDYSVKQSYYGLAYANPDKTIGQSEQQALDFSFQKIGLTQAKPDYSKQSSSKIEADSPYGTVRKVKQKPVDGSPLNFNAPPERSQQLKGLAESKQQQIQKPTGIEKDTRPRFDRRQQQMSGVSSQTQRRGPVSGVERTGPKSKKKVTQTYPDFSVKRSNFELAHDGMDATEERSEEKAMDMSLWKLNEFSKRQQITGMTYGTKQRNSKVFEKQDSRRKAVSTRKSSPPEYSNQRQTSPTKTNSEAQASELLPERETPQSVKAMCGEQTLQLTVKMDFFGTGALIDPDDISLGDCGPTELDESQHELLFETALHECKSTVEMTDDLVIYSFSLNYNPKPIADVPIMRTNQATVEIECYYNRFHNVSSNSVRPTWTPFVTSQKAEETLDFSFRLMTDDWQYERPSATYFLGDMINIEASVGVHGHVPLRVYIDNCVAAVEPEQSSATYTLIENHGCLSDSKLTSSHSQFLPREENDKIRLQLEAFKFAHEDNDSFYLTCTLRAVPSENPSDNLHKACHYHMDSQRWSSADGNDEVCACCDVGKCQVRKGRSVNNPMRNSVVIGPITISI